MADATDTPSNTAGDGAVPRVFAAPEVARVPLAVLGARVMLEQVDRILEHEAGARSGEDVEDVHKMRVAARRLRTALRVFGKALEKAIGVEVLEGLRQDLKRISIPLGRVRDLDVFTEALQQRALAAPFGDAPALERLVADREYERQVARAALLAAMDGDAMQRLRTTARDTLADLANWLDLEAKRHPRKRDLARVRAPKLILRRLRSLRRRGEAMRAPTVDELHGARIAAKRLRYTGEFFSPVFPGALDELIQQVTELQDTLGAIHDCDVACETLLLDIARLAEEDDRTADTAAIARLVSRYRAERDEATAFVREEWERLPAPGKVRRRLRD